MTVFRATVRPGALLAAVLGAVMLLAGCASVRSPAVHAAARPTPARTTPAHTTPARTTPARTATSAAATPVTVVHTAAPWTATGHLTVASRGTAPGSCFTTSLAAPAPTAYRCFGGNALLDPCFVSPVSDRTVACLATPWSRAQVLTLRTPPPAPVRTGSGRYWALQLADGTRCVAATGTVPQVAGVDLSYSCADGTYAEPVDSAAPRVVVQRARLDAAALTRTPVSVAWRA